MEIFLSVIVAAFMVFIILKLKSPKFKGAVGEFKVSSVLCFLGKEYIVLNDLLVRTSNGSTSQIDHVVLSHYGIFVIETKNYKGWIFGSENAEYWTQVIFKEKHKFVNPIKQNYSHIGALKNILRDFPQVKYFPIVVFSGSAELKEINSSVPVVYDNLLNSVIKNRSTEICISDDDVLKIKSLLEASMLTEKSARKTHIKDIHKTIVEKRIKKENLICPRCNGKLKLRESKHGRFYGCSNYPRCKFTMNC